VNGVHKSATYYAKFVEEQVTINYVVVGPDGCGTVTPTSETVNVITGTPSSTAEPSSNEFRFVGWYSDPECTQRLSTNPTYNPRKASSGFHVEATYYAKFEYNLTTMTITKTVTDAEALRVDADQTFVFTVTGKGIENGIQVVLKAGESVTISGVTVGETYTVTEDTGWSWRFTPEDGSISHTLDVSGSSANNQFEFLNAYTRKQWLNDCDRNINTWNGSSIKRKEE